MIPGIMPVIGGGRTIESVALQSNTTNSGTTIAWPSVQAGDLAVLVDLATSAFGTPGVGLPSGFTSLATAAAGSSPDGLRGTVSYKICTGAESGNITGISTGDPQKRLLVFRANIPIGTVTPSSLGAGNCTATTGNPAAIVVPQPPVPAIVLGVAGATGTPAFSTASPSFDATYTDALQFITGLKTYLINPASHTVDMNDLGTNFLFADYLELGA